MPQIFGTLVPAAGQSEPVINADSVKGSYQVVPNTVARNNIPPERREEGMSCYVQDIKKLYRLIDGIDNANWEEDLTGAGEYIGSVDIWHCSPKTLTDAVKSLARYLFEHVANTKIDSTYSTEGVPFSDVADYWNPSPSLPEYLNDAFESILDAALVHLPITQIPCSGTNSSGIPYSGDNGKWTTAPGSLNEAVECLATALKIHFAHRLRGLFSCGTCQYAALTSVWSGGLPKTINETIQLLATAVAAYVSSPITKVVSTFVGCKYSDIDGSNWAGGTAPLRTIDAIESIALSLSTFTGSPIPALGAEIEGCRYIGNPSYWTNVPLTVQEALEALSVEYYIRSGLQIPGPSGGAHSLGGAEHLADTLANLNAKITDATLIDTGDPRLSDARIPTTHGLGGTEHSTTTLAGLNAKISDANLIDTNDFRLSNARTPLGHGGTHTNGTDDVANFVGDSGAGGSKGLVPAPSVGYGALKKALLASGVWGVPNVATEYQYIVASKDNGATEADVSDPAFLHENGITNGLRNAMMAAGGKPIFIRPGTYEGLFNIYSELHGSGSQNGTILKPELVPTGPAMLLVKSRNLEIALPGGAIGSATDSAIEFYESGEHIRVYTTFGQADPTYRFIASFASSGNVRAVFNNFKCERWHGEHCGYLYNFTVRLINSYFQAGTGTTPIGKSAIYFNDAGAHTNTLIGCYAQIVNSTPFAGASVIIAYGSNSVFLGNNFVNGVKIGDETFGTPISDNTSISFLGNKIGQAAGGRALWFVPTTGRKISNITFVGNALEGNIYMEGDSADISRISAISFTGNAADAKRLDAQYATGVSWVGGILSGVYILNCKNVRFFGPDVPTITTVGLEAVANVSGQGEGEDIAFISCSIADRTGTQALNTPIKVTGCKSPRVLGNSSKTKTGTTIYGAYIANCPDAKISSNTLEDLGSDANMHYGIFVVGTCPNISMNDNSILMNTSAVNRVGIKADTAGITGICGLNTYRGNVGSTPYSLNAPPAIDAGLNHSE